MPYLARPAWLSGGPDQVEDKPSSSTGSAPVGPGSAPVAGGASPPGEFGTGFVNLQNYLSGNREQAAGFATQNIVNPMNQEGQAVSGLAAGHADQMAHYNQDAQSRAAAEKANEGRDPMALNPAWSNYQGKGTPTEGIQGFFNQGKPRSYEEQANAAGHLPGKAGADRFRAWQGANPEPEKYQGLLPVPGVMPKPKEPTGLGGRASAVNADRKATGSMAGRGSLFNRAAGGYGYGNFDTYLSGGAPWAGANSYPTLWQQIQGNPGNVRSHGTDPSTPDVPGTYASKKKTGY